MSAKYYKIQVNEDDETGVDFNSLVDVPAHMRGFIAFNEQLELYRFSEEERTVTGCMIAVDMPIRRVSKDLGEHYVIFDAKTVKIINLKIAKNNFANNVNTQHDSATETKEAFQVSRFIASNSDDRLPNIPQIFDKQKIADGSLFATYYIQNDNLWNDVKAGKFQGFSVEGWFDKREVRVKIKTNKQKMSKPNFWENAKTFFGVEVATPEVAPIELHFTEATTADGVIVFFEGELIEGVVVQIEVDGVKIPAPEGQHEITFEDGAVKIITVDAAGVVTAIEDAQVEEVQAEIEAVEPDGQAVFMKEFVTATEERFNALEAENVSLKAEIANAITGEKFNKQTKQTGENQKMSVSDIIKQMPK